MMCEAVTVRDGMPVHECCGAKSPGKSGRGTKELVKVGMAVCLGALVVTGMCNRPNARRWHALAGTALVGLSVWHHLLYTPNTKKAS